MRFSPKAGLALAALTLLALGTASAQAGTDDFDGVAASPFFNETTPGGPAGPTVVYSDITFTGGVILDGSGFAGEETTSPNLYATSDFNGLSDGSLLPGVITGTFSSIYSGPLSLDVANGFGASDFTLSAFDASNNLIASETEFLDGFFSGAGATEHFSITGSGISYFTVTSAQDQGAIDFGIDTVKTGAPVPEASTTASFGLLMVLGLGGLAVARRRKSVQA